MYLLLMFAFCVLGGAYGVWAILRDIGRGRVQARGFGFDKATQPKRYFALMAFNCFAVGLLLIGVVVLGVSLLHRLVSG